MNKLKRIALYGISGAGKTTILTKVSTLMPELIWLEGAKLITKTEKITLDFFKKLPEKQKYILRERAISQALKLQAKEKHHIIIDAHVSFIDGDKFHNIITQKDVNFYTDYLYLRLPAEVILNRQQNDKNRKRNYSLDVISEWIQFELYELKKLCERENINLHLLNSTSNQICANSVCNYIKGRQSD